MAFVGVGGARTTWDLLLNWKKLADRFVRYEEHGLPTAAILFIQVAEVLDYHAWREVRFEPGFDGLTRAAGSGVAVLHPQCLYHGHSLRKAPS